VAEQLETVLADRGKEGVELLAHHWQHAQEPKKAVHYLVEAGSRARYLGASLEAVRFYEAALPQAQALPKRERTVHLRQIHERMGDVYFEALSRHDEALAHYQAFLSLAQVDEDRARGERKVGGVYMLRGDLARAQSSLDRALSILDPLPPHAETSRVRFALAYLFVLRNDLECAAAHADASLEAARVVDDARGIADAYRERGVIASMQGQVEESITFQERSLALYRELGDLMRTTQTCNNIGNSYRLVGRMVEARAHLDEGLEIARRIGDTRDEALILITTGELLLDRGETAQALAHLEQALSLAERSGVIARRIAAHAVLGEACDRAGRLDEALQHLQAAAQLGEETRIDRFAARTQLALAHLAAKQGAIERAATHADRAARAAGADPSDRFRGLAHRCRAHIAAQRGDWDSAVAHLEEGLHCLERAGLAVEVCETHMRLGTAYVNRDRLGDRERACGQLHAAIPVLSQIGAAEALARANAQLRAWECTPSTPESPAPGSRDA
jgi:tetratricopeptide (TPR) repeat protein